ncbi:MAG: hypothetical protein II721_03220 [Bacilli bacterium]|nr:hypothetical protein [Bacilli bacterium]
MTNDNKMLFDGSDLNKVFEAISNEEKIGITVLQKVLGIGFVRASRLYEKLLEIGMITKIDGRTCVVNKNWQ